MELAESELEVKELEPVICAGSGRGTTNETFVGSREEFRLKVAADLTSGSARSNLTSNLNWLTFVTVPEAI